MTDLRPPFISQAVAARLLGVVGGYIRAHPAAFPHATAKLAALRDLDSHRGTRITIEEIAAAEREQDEVRAAWRVVNQLRSGRKRA
jgi:hypothetical protein